MIIPAPPATHPAPQATATGHCEAVAEADGPGESDQPPEPPEAPEAEGRWFGFGAADTPHG